MLRRSIDTTAPDQNTGIGRFFAAFAALIA